MTREHVFGSVFGFLFGIFIMVICLFGIAGLPTDFEVEPEYLSGMLTASSILFGFWVAIIQRKPKKGEVILTYFLLSFTLLCVSVVAIYLTALNKIPSHDALLICMASFLMNAVNLALILYVYKFKETRSE